MMGSIGILLWKLSSPTRPSHQKPYNQSNTRHYLPTVPTHPLSLPLPHFLSPLRRTTTRHESGPMINSKDREASKLSRHSVFTITKQAAPELPTTTTSQIQKLMTGVEPQSVTLTELDYT